MAKRLIMRAYNKKYIMDLLCLEELKKTFNKIRIPSVYYSINGYSEDAVCIEQNCNDWIVYNGERGNKYNVNKYSDIEEACNELILRISENEKERLKIQKIFNKNIKKQLKRRANLKANRIRVAMIIRESCMNQQSKKMRQNAKIYKMRKRKLIVKHEFSEKGRRLHEKTN